MKLSDFLQTPRERFDHELSAKTGWGRTEVKQAFERALSDSLAAHARLE